MSSVTQHPLPYWVQKKRRVNCLAVRLIIFLILAFFPFYIIIPIMWTYFGEPIFISENPDVMVANYCVGVFGMMIPSLAHLFTRLITKEGFKNSYLGMNIKGKLGYWLSSVLVPLAYSALTVILIWVIYINELTFPEAFSGFGMQTTGIFLLQLSYTLICFFPAFGEEWGWRGYMMPKLMELMPKPVAVVVGGVLWGLWHAPLTVAGHNFGVDYPGYPFVGIGFMCVMCTALNAFLTLITEKTKSIYPAAFTHAVNNNLSMGVLFSLFGSEAAMEKLGTISNVDMFLVYIPMQLVVGMICMILLLRKGRPSKQRSQ